MRKYCRILPKIGHLLWCWDVWFSARGARSWFSSFIQNCLCQLCLMWSVLSQKFFLKFRKKKVAHTAFRENFQRLFGETAEQESVVNMAKKWEITVLRKGVVDVIEFKNRRNSCGCSAMAVGGTEMLLQNLWRILAQGLTPFETDVLAALHWGKAGETLQKDWRLFPEELITFFRKR